MAAINFYCLIQSDHSRKLPTAAVFLHSRRSSSLLVLSWQICRWECFLHHEVNHKNYRVNNAAINNVNVRYVLRKSYWSKCYSEYLCKVDLQCVFSSELEQHLSSVITSHSKQKRDPLTNFHSEIGDHRVQIYVSNSELRILVDTWQCFLSVDEWLFT